jgi:hypothetical protein
MRNLVCYIFFLRLLWDFVVAGALYRELWGDFEKLLHGEL